MESNPAKRPSADKICAITEFVFGSESQTTGEPFKPLSPSNSATDTNPSETDLHARTSSVESSHRQEQSGETGNSNENNTSTLQTDTVTGEIESLEFVTVSGPNTHIAALASESNNNGRAISQFRLWDARTGVLVWKSRLPQNDSDAVLPGVFSTCGRHFCFYDGVEKIIGLDIEKLQEEAMVNLSSCISFEAEMPPFRPIAIAVNAAATRIALAECDPEVSSTSQITLNTVSHDGYERKIERVRAKGISTDDTSFPTMHYTDQKDLLFVVWKGQTAFLVIAFNVKTQQTIGRIEYGRDTLRGPWHNNVRVYGCTIINKAECIILTVPTKLKPGIFDRLRGQNKPSGFAAVAVNFNGQEVARFFEFEGKLSRQSQDMTISDGEIIRWQGAMNGQGIVEVWVRDGLFQTLYRFMCKDLSSSGDRVAYHSGTLTLLSRLGKLRILTLSRRARDLDRG